MKACLFSGGVFRGVFQMGVMNALALLELKPNMVAGASVGSITAAMVASALLEKDQQSTARKVAQLSAVYLGIDRIVLTDKFADFIRNWTIRASEAKFSLRQADEVFRKYDAQSSRAFQKDVRQVVAGLERLFYINPYQLNELVRLARSRQVAEFRIQLKDRVQQWLDRMDVGEEVLGAEALRLLIEELVIPLDFQDNPAAAPFDCFGEGFHFLATTTNLTRGKLKVLGRKKFDDFVTLQEGLLASSAFPGVFRPRRSWDLMPGTKETDQYIDGGVMDNLPVDSVLKEMEELAKQRVIEKRPEAGPHLMLAASLEVTRQNYAGSDLDSLENYWPELALRSQELKYNTKLDTFSRVAQNIQDLYKKNQGAHEPVNVKVLSIKPRWLCSTFAFHPMLGFRKIMQAQSIAHGCAATLLTFGSASQYAEAWGLNKKAIPKVTDFDTALNTLKKPRRVFRKGGCWLQDKKCPYSKAELDKSVGSDLDKKTKRWLSRIHKSCWKRETHQPH